MPGTITVCTEWSDRHDRPVYTLDDTCPACGAPTRAAGPAPFNPTDRHGKYRRALKRRRRQ